MTRGPNFDLFTYELVDLGSVLYQMAQIIFLNQKGIVLIMFYAFTIFNWYIKDLDNSLL